MELKQEDMKEIYKILVIIEEALKSKGILMDDEGELTEDFKIELEKRRKTPDSKYIALGEVKKRVLKNNGF